MFEIIIEFILLWFIQYPGAFIRWIIFRKHPLNYYLKQDLSINSFPLILIAIAAIVFKYM